MYNKVKPGVDEGTKALERLAEASDDVRESIHKTNLLHLEGLKLDAAMKAAKLLSDFKQRFDELTPISQQFYDSLEYGIKQGRGIQTLQQITESYRKMRDAGKLTAEDMRQILKLIRSFTGPGYDALRMIDDITKQIEAYKQAADGLLKTDNGNGPPPNENTASDANEAADALARVYEIYSKLPDEITRTADAIDRIQQHTERGLVLRISAGSDDRAIDVAVRELYDAALAEWKESVERQSFLQEIADSFIGDLPDAAEGIKQGMEILAEDAYRAHMEAVERKNWAVAVSESFLGDLPDAEEAVATGLKAILAGAMYDVAIDVGVREAAASLNAVLMDAIINGSRDQAIESELRNQAIQRIKQMAELYKNAANSMISGGLFNLAFVDNRRWKEFALTVEYLFNNIPQWVDNSDAALERLRKRADELQAEFMALSSAITSAFGAFESYESGDTEGAILGITNTLASLASMIPEIGDGIAAAIQLLGTLIAKFWDSITDPTGARRADRTLTEVADKYKLIGKEAFEVAKQTTKAQKGFWIFKREVTKVTINQELLQATEAIARTLESGVEGALRSGIKAFLEGKADWRTQLRDGIRDAIYDGIIEAVIQAGIIQGMLADEFTALNKALTEQNWEEAQRVTSDIINRIPEVEEKVQDIFSQFRLPGSAGSTDGGITTYTYDLPTAPVLATPAWTLEVFTPDGATLKATYTEAAPGGITGSFKLTVEGSGNCKQFTFTGRPSALAIGPRDIIKFSADGVDLFYGYASIAWPQFDKAEREYVILGAARLLDARLMDEQSPRRWRERNVA